MKRSMPMLLTLLALVACGEEGNSVVDAPAMDAPDPTPDAAQSEPDGAAPSEPGAPELIVLEHEGLERSYLLYVPASVDCEEQVPLVVNYHALTGTPEGQRILTRLDELADRERFVTAYPTGVDRSFNGGTCCGKNSSLALSTSEADDAGFTRVLIEDIARRTCVDRSRMYSMGMSNGGFMSEYNACTNADLFAAVAVVSALALQQPSCDPLRPISLIAFNGTEDSFSSASGAQPVVLGWVERNGCTGEPSRQAMGDSFCDTWSQCSTEVEVTACTVTGMEHCWPGSPLTWQDCKTGGLEDIDATMVAWEFLRRHRLPDTWDADAGSP